MNQSANPTPHPHPPPTPRPPRRQSPSATPFPLSTSAGRRQILDSTKTGRPRPLPAILPPCRVTPLMRSLAVLAILAAPLTAPAAPPRPAVEYFEKHIRPVLVQKCQKCHGPKKQSSGLRLDSRVALLKGGNTSPAI